MFVSHYYINVLAIFQKFQIFFFLHRFSFTNIHDLQGARGRGKLYFNFSLSFPPYSQTPQRFASVHSQQPDSSKEPLGSERKSLNTHLHAFRSLQIFPCFANFIVPFFEPAYKLDNIISIAAIGHFRITIYRKIKANFSKIMKVYH